MKSLAIPARNVAGLFGMFFLLGARSVPPAEYRILPMPVGATVAIPRDLNDRDEVVGFAAVETGPVPVRWRNGQPEFLPVGLSGIANAINNAGDVCGQALSIQGDQPVLWRNGTMEPLPTLGQGGYAIDLNDRGEVLGVVFEAGIERPAVWRNGVLQVLSTGRFGSVEARVIDEQGRIFGEAIVRERGVEVARTPVQWVGDSPMPMSNNLQDHRLRSDGEVFGAARDANDRRVVGGSTHLTRTFSGDSAPARWENGMMRRLPVPPSASGGIAIATQRGGDTFGELRSAFESTYPVMWDAHGSQRLPIPDGFGVTNLVAANGTGTVLGRHLNAEGRLTPIVWKTSEFTRLIMPNLHTGRVNRLALRAEVRVGGQPVANVPTEFQIDGRTVGTPRTDANGVASLLVPANLYRPGRHVVMFSLGGSRYLFRDWIVGTADTDVQVMPERAWPGQPVLLQARLFSIATGEAVGRRPVQFWVGNMMLGRAETDASGLARLPMTMSRLFGRGDHRLTVRFAGDASYATAVGGATLSIVR